MHEDANDAARASGITPSSLDMSVTTTLRLSLLLVVSLVYASSLRGHFLLWDDTQHILLNPHLRAADFGYFWSNTYYGLFVPIIYSVWSLLFMVSEEPLIFHSFNLLLHSANALLVFELLRHWLKAEPLHAFLGTMVFALHPLQVEPVAWISGGRDLLSGFFGMAATLLMVRAAVGRTLFKQSLFLGATLFFALGLLSKPTLAPLPVALFVIDLFRPKENRVFPRPHLAIWALMGSALLAFTFSHQAALTDPRLEASWTERGLVAVDAAGFYLNSLFVPWNLSFSYDRTIQGILTEKSYIASIAWLAAGAGLVILLARTFGQQMYGYTLFGAAFLLPVLGLVPFAGQAQSTVFDRYMYLPMLGVALAVGHLARINIFRQMLLVSLAALTALSAKRTMDWQSNRSLSQTALDIKPDNFLALNNLAIQEIEDRNLARAERLLRGAWQSRPKEALAAANLAHALWLRNDLGGVLQEIVPLTKNVPFLDYNQREVESLAMIHRMTARALNATLDRVGAERAYSKAVNYLPDDPELRNEFLLFIQEE